MSDSSSKRAPSVSILAIFVLLGAFALLVRYIYLPRDTGAFPDDGIHTAAMRKKNLEELRAKHNHELETYAWVDQKAGVVQLPIERAMQLTLQKYEKKP